MAKHRSRSWLFAVALLLLSLLGLWLGVVCRGPSRSDDAISTKSADTNQGFHSHAGLSGPAETEDPTEDGIAPDGLSLLGRVIYPDGRPAEGATVRLLSRPNGAPHASMARRVAKTE